jgi:hypothetical protein
MPKLTAPEREAKRNAELEQAREAVEALKKTEGSKRWLELRRHFHRYSFANQLGYCVKRGEKALRVWVLTEPGSAGNGSGMCDIISPPRPNVVQTGSAGNRIGPRRIWFQTPYGPHLRFRATFRSRGFLALAGTSFVESRRPDSNRGPPSLRVRPGQSGRPLRSALIPQHRCKAQGFADFACLQCTWLTWGFWTHTDPIRARVWLNSRERPAPAQRVSTPARGYGPVRP